MDENEGVKEKLTTGQLSLSSAAAVQTFFREEEREHKHIITPEEKEKIISEIKDKNIRQTRRHIDDMKISLHGESVGKSNNRPIKIELDSETAKELAELQKISGGKEAKVLIKQLIRYELEKLKKRVTKQESQESNVKQNKTQSTQLTNQTEEQTICSPKTHSRYIPASVRAAVLSRANGRCEYISPITGERCTEIRNLQVDHEFAWGLGGSNDINNLQGICPACNTRRAINTYGLEKMNPYINKKSVHRQDAS
ncbi:MAG: HNH endonuclease [Oligoflexia bacterium]|nr:HNH endonuclease [Oligoflexia bacterium]